MITDKQKEEIFLKIAPFELYYDDDIYMEHIHNGVLQSLSNEFENENLFSTAVNDLLKLNSVLFFNAISKSKLPKIDFIDYVNSQYNRFKEDSEGEGLTEWLNYTKKIVFDKELCFYPKKVNTANKGAFMDWYNETLTIEITEVTEETKEKRVPVPQIALKYYYEGIHITEVNKNEIAKKYGWIAKNSGVGLLHDYQYYCESRNRIINPSKDHRTPLKLNRKIKLFETVLKLLPEGKKAKAFGDISILKSKLPDY